jgi:hypothetical protein
VDYSRTNTGLTTLLIGFSKKVDASFRPWDRARAIIKRARTARLFFQLTKQYDPLVMNYIDLYQTVRCLDDVEFFAAAIGRSQVKPLFTVHAGEFLVGCEIEKKYPRVNVWVPAKDTGIDFLLTDKDNARTLSLQVKFSRDYLATHAKEFGNRLRAFGWWTPTRQQIETSRAQYWVFVLFGFATSNTEFIFIKPGELRERLTAIHGATVNKFQSYLWVTHQGKCFETRGLTHAEKVSIAEGRYDNPSRNFTTYLDKWDPIKALNE